MIRLCRLELGLLLVAPGLKVTGKLSTQKAVIAGIIVWLIGALFPVLQALKAW